MNQAHHISAQMLRETRRRIAENLCSGSSYSNTAGQASTSPAEFEKAKEQAEEHLHILAACIEFSSPLLLEDYVRWIVSLPADVSPYVGDIAKFFGDVSRFVELQFPAETSLPVNHFIDRALNSLSNEAGADDHRLAENLPTENPLASVQHSYLELLLEKRREDALRLVLETVNSGVDIESIYLNVFQPAQHKIGSLWQAGTINVAQEHYCTAATQFIMAQLQPYFVTGDPAGKTLVASCVGDELHEVGLRIVADLFEVNGWNSIYLGANAPAKSIAETMVSSSAQILAISTTMPQHLFKLAEVIQVVRSHPGCEQVKVMVGGYPFNVDPFLWQRVGADAGAADGKDAISVAGRLIGSADKPHAVVRLPDAPGIAATTRRDVDQSQDDLSRLNNNLVTLQRELTKANTKLAAMNKANQEKAEALQRADQRKDEFMAMLAHELRGPLAPMELAIGLLQMEDVKPAVVEEACGTMKRQLQQMKRLVSDLLDASRIAHGKIGIKPATLDLTSVIHRAVEIVQPLVQDKLQELELDICGGPLAIHGDEIRLAQVFANLLTNASKYNGRKGKIWLRTRRERDMAVIEVSDNGVGIEADLLPDVFSTFAQEERSRHHSMGGLGLGLSLVKQLVELHGGTVKAESEGADKGSVFVVCLPAIEPEPVLVSVEPDLTEDGKQAAPSRNVLIVEDTAGIARITAILFEKLGHTAEIAHDGATAIQKYKALQPEIVVLDLTLPDMSGLDVTKEIRQIDTANKTLIVALTGHDDDEHRRKARESGCDEYLVKPVDIRVLKGLGTHPKLMAANGNH